MNSPETTLEYGHRQTILASTLTALVLLSGCLTDPVLSGLDSPCNLTLDCNPGLICVARVCALPPAQESLNPRDAGVANDAGGAQSDVPTADLPPEEDSGQMTGDTTPVPPDTTPTTDGGLICEPGERVCETNTIIRVCTSAGTLTTELCASGTICQQGLCVPQSSCEDRDGDGFPAGDKCVSILDCNDSNTSIYPGAPEVCDGFDNDCNGQQDEVADRPCDSICGQGVSQCINGAWGECSAQQPAAEEICDNNIDDDCNGRIDDGCNTCCTPGSCPAEQLCVDCLCRDAPEDECLFQNQPCDPFVAEGEEEFFCVDFEGNGDGICLGICSLRAPNPNSTCPTDDAICAFEISDTEGVCLNSCDPSTGTGCFEGQGCVLLGSQGACVQAGDIAENEICDPNFGTFGQCEEGSVCIEGFENFDGICQRLCDPLAPVQGQSGNCDAGTGCFPIGGGFGFCLPTIDEFEGDECSREERGRQCSDGSICERVGRNENVCLPLCIFDNGDADCDDGTRCRFSDSFESEDIGFCR